MHFKFTSVFALLLPLGLAAPAPIGPPSPDLVAALNITNPGASNVVPNSYLVIYKNGMKDSDRKKHEKDAEDKLSKLPDSHKYQGIVSTFDMGDGSFAGYHVVTPPAGLAQLNSTIIGYVELDVYGTANPLGQSNITNSGGEIATVSPTPDYLVQWVSSPWGLSRISHRVLPKNPFPTNYIFDNSECSGTRAYVLDTGIRITHQEFKDGGSTSRANYGANFITPTAASGDDNGHGTHCAGTIGGYRTGVCLQTQLWAVKVCNGAGSCPASALISGIQWAVNHAKAAGFQKKSVLSISLGFPYVSAINSAITAAFNLGFPVIVAAGNNGASACQYSPSSANGSITVAASDVNDVQPSWSNYGPCVDIHGPGVGIFSTWNACDTCYNTLSGTSMATPHIAGLSAYFIAKDGISGGTAVLARLTSLATKGVFTAGNLNGSPNSLGYNGDGY